MSQGKVPNSGFLSMQSLHGAVQAVEQAHIVLVQIVGTRPCPLLAMQIGLAVMLGKRIVVLVEGDAEVPELLKKVAFHVGQAGETQEETLAIIKQVCEMAEIEDEADRKERLRRAELN